MSCASCMNLESVVVLEAMDSVSGRSEWYVYGSPASEWVSGRRGHCGVCIGAARKKSNGGWACRGCILPVRDDLLLGTASGDQMSILPGNKAGGTGTSAPSSPPTLPRPQPEATAAAVGDQPPNFGAPSTTCMHPAVFPLLHEPVVSAQFR